MFLEIGIEIGPSQFQGANCKELQDVGSRAGGAGFAKTETSNANWHNTKNLGGAKCNSANFIILWSSNLIYIYRWAASGNCRIGACPVCSRTRSTSTARGLTSLG